MSKAEHKRLGYFTREVNVRNRELKQLMALNFQLVHSKTISLPTIIIR